MKVANIKITNYEIKSEIDKKIVLISDIHYYSRRDLNKLESIYNKIKTLNPNYRTTYFKIKKTI